MTPAARRVLKLRRVAKAVVPAELPKKDMYGVDARSERSGSRDDERNEGWYGAKIPVIMGFQRNETR